MLRVGAFGAAIVMGLALAYGAQSAVMIGNASTVVREVRSTLETRERILIVDDDVFQDEEVTTGALSAARLIFKDGTNMSMGAQSRLKLTTVLFDPDPSKSKVAMRAALGVFRMATGNLPSSAYQVATPVATISVRGTTIEFTVTGIGTTTVYVARGAATVRSNNGDEVELEAGQSTTVRAEGVGGSIVAGSPTDPTSPSEEFSKQVRAMTVTLRSDEPATDQLPGGGYFRAPPPPSNPFPLRPPPRNGGGGGPPIGGPIGGPGTGGPSTPTSPNTPTSPPPPPGNGDGGGAVPAEIEVPEPKISNAFTRVGSTSDVIVTIKRIDSGLGEIVGTLDGSSGIFTGPGSGPDGVRLLQGGQMEFTYVFAPQQAGTFTTAIPYDFPGYGISGVVDLFGQAINPTLSVHPGGKGGGGATAQAARTGAFSHSVRIANDTPDVAPIDVVGITILSAYVQGAGGEMFTISGLESDTVLGAGEEIFLTISFDPNEEGLDPMLLAALGEVDLYILTDLNADFGSAGSLLKFRLSFGDDPIAIVVPPVGLVLMCGGSLFLFAGSRRRQR